MTADVPALLSTLDPETASLVREALSLPEGERPDLTAELDATSAAYSDLVAGITLWSLKDTMGLWARVQDAAAAFGVTSQSLAKQIDASRTLTSAMVRRGVVDSDVDTSTSTNGCGSLTTSPAGCTMLNLDALMLLGMKARGERGDKLALQIKAIVDAFPKLQRVCVRLLRAHQSRPSQPAVSDSATYARRLLDGLVANGAKVLPRDLIAAAALTMAPPAVSAEPPALALTATDSPPLDFGPEYSVGLIANARTVGLTHKKLRRLLETTGMWDDPHWVRHGEVIMSGAGKQRTETRHGLRNGWYQELVKRHGPLFASGGAK